MSKARSRGCVRPTNSPQAPGAGTKGYLRVLARGCGSEVDYWGDGDCAHEYGWSCDDCPLEIESSLDHKCRRIAAIKEFQGPPREFSHPMESWVYPSVCSEIHLIYSQPELEDLLARFARIGPVGVVLW